MASLITRYWKLAAVWALSLIVVGMVSSHAQAQQPSPAERMRRESLLLEGPLIVSGTDVGFRIERTKDGIPIGKVIVRINGKWLDTLPSESAN